MKPDQHDDADRYAGAGQRWATGATLVYGPIAGELVAMSPRSLAGRTVLDVGAGTGAVSAALADIGARAVAVDRALDMLAWDAKARPPAAVADVRALPLPDGGVDAAIAAFVLNHLVVPADGLAELRRVTTPGGPILATVFSNASRSPARDQIDVVAQEAGWQVPDWYAELKAAAMPVLGTAAAMRTAADAAGLANVVVAERPVDVGVTTAEQLVRYRLGQPLFASWLDHIGPAAAERFAVAATAAVRPVMQPYKPIVVFLAATAPSA